MTEENSGQPQKTQPPQTPPPTTAVPAGGKTAPVNIKKMFDGKPTTEQEKSEPKTEKKHENHQKTHQNKPSHTEAPTPKKTEAPHPAQTQAPKPKKEESKKEPKESKEAPTSDFAEEDGGELIWEEESGFFWVLQGVVWGILKTGVLLGVLVFLVWAVWGGGTFPFFSGGRTSEEVQKQPLALEVETKPVEIPIPVQEASTPRSIQPEDLTEVGAQWLGRTRTLAERTVPALAQVVDSSQRSQQLQLAMEETQTLLAESTLLQRLLSQEVQTLRGQESIFKKEAKRSEEAQFEALQNGQEVAAATQQLATARQDLVAAQTYLTVRETLLKNIQNFTILLRRQVVPLVVPETQLTPVQ